MKKVFLSLASLLLLASCATKLSQEQLSPIYGEYPANFVEIVEDYYKDYSLKCYDSNDIRQEYTEITKPRTGFIAQLVVQQERDDSLWPPSTAQRTQYYKWVSTYNTPIYRSSGWIVVATGYIVDVYQRWVNHLGKVVFENKDTFLLNNRRIVKVLDKSAIIERVTVGGKVVLKNGPDKGNGNCVFEKERRLGE